MPQALCMCPTRELVVQNLQVGCWHRPPSRLQATCVHGVCRSRPSHPPVVDAASPMLQAGMVEAAPAWSLKAAACFPGRQVLSKMGKYTSITATSTASDDGPRREAIRDQVRFLSSGADQQPPAGDAGCAQEGRRRGTRGVLVQHVLSQCSTAVQAISIAWLLVIW